MSFLCKSCVLACHRLWLVFTPCHPHVTRMSLVCTRMSSLCHSYVVETKGRVSLVDIWKNFSWQSFIGIKPADHWWSLGKTNMKTNNWQNSISFLSSIVCNFKTPRVKNLICSNSISSFNHDTKGNYFDSQTY